MDCPTFFHVPDNYTYLTGAYELDSELVASVEFVGDEERRRLVFTAKSKRERQQLGFALRPH